MYIKQVNERQVFFGGTLKVGDKQIINPTHEQLLKEGWEEYTLPVVEAYIPTYEEKVEQMIRKKYSVSDELAILRQRDTKKDEFDQYFAFCEACKSEAKNKEIERMELNNYRYE